VVRGISTANTARRAVAIAIAGAAATALSACGAGLDTQTDEKQSAIAGVNIDDGTIALRDLQVEFDSAEGYAVGDDAALRLWIGNEGDQEISLDGIETEAGTVTYLDPVAQAEEAAEAARESTSEEADTDDAESSAPAADATEAPEDEALEGEVDFDPIAIAPADYVRLDQGVSTGTYFLIENLKEELVSGATIDVVFHFSDGTEVPASLPVGQALEPEEREYYEPEEAAEGH
jgi:copper(I)-binding protein